MFDHLRLTFGSAPLGCTSALLLEMTSTKTSDKKIIFGAASKHLLFPGKLQMWTQFLLLC